MDVDFLDQLQHGFHINLGRCQQMVSQRLAFQIGGGWVGVADFQDFAHQRVAVGVRAGSAQGDQGIAGLNLAAVDDFGFLDHADAEAGHVVIFAMVHARHFGGFTPNQRTTRLLAAFGDTGNHAGRGVHVQFAGREVIQEEQRLGALYHQIVHTHCNQIDADGVVSFQVHRQTQLGAYAVGTGHQNRLAVFLRQRTQGAKTAQTSHNFRAAGLFNYTFDAVYQCIASIDIDTCVFIAERGFVGHCAIPTTVCGLKTVHPALIPD